MALTGDGQNPCPPGSRLPRQKGPHGGHMRGQEIDERANPADIPRVLARQQPKIGLHAGDRADAAHQIGVRIGQNTGQDRDP